MKKIFKRFYVVALIVPMLGFSSCEKDSAGFANSVLWKAAKNGKISFVMGSIHIPDNRFERLPDEVLRALESCSILLEEMEPDREGQMKISRGMELPPGMSLRTLVGEDLFGRLAKVASAMNPPFAESILENKKIWAAALLISFPRNSADSSLEIVVHEQAKRFGLKTGGLETPEEQIAALDSFTADEQLELLRDGIEEAEGGFQTARLLVERYFTQDLAGISELLLEHESRFSSELREKYLEKVLYDRNRLFFDRALQYLENGGCFIVIGAGHLAGKSSLLNIMHDNGFTLEPVSFEFERDTSVLLTK